MFLTHFLVFNWYQSRYTRCGLNTWVWSLTLFEMDRSQSLNVPPYFDGSNYAFWKVRVRAFLLLGHMCFLCYRTYVMILCTWLILWQNALYLYLGRLRMCLTTSRNYVSRSSVETFKFVQEIKKSANSLKLDRWSIPAWHLLSVKI